MTRKNRTTKTHEQIHEWNLITGLNRAGFRIHQTWRGEEEGALLLDQFPPKLQEKLNENKNAFQ